jgi:aryl-alcohol dehydrogenase-like predicted oxidoreductase
MLTRPFDGVPVSEVGLGCWQIGGDQWGDVSDADALATLHAAADAGTTFLDTADVYGAGRSETLVGKFLKERRERFFVATKFGRFPTPDLPDNCTPVNIRRHTENSLRRLGVESLDLTQLHCVPQPILERGEVFDAVRQLQREGKIQRWGASVESTAEAKLCLAQEGCKSLQIIFNIFRQTPITALFDECRAKHVSVIVRLPLASGLLAGKYTPRTTFAATDHRTYNQHGEKFNVGETFAGLGFEKGLEVTDKIRPLVPAGWTMSEFALRWCLDYPAVTTIIPGARNPEQARANATAGGRPSLGPVIHDHLRRLYGEEIAPFVRGPD